MHFEKVAAIGQQMCKLLGEDENCEWFSQSYLVAPYNGWWVGASEETGVTSSNNDIETFWKIMKTFMCMRTRVGHRKLLEYVFPQMLFLMTPDYSGPPSRRSNYIHPGSRLNASAVYLGSDVPMVARAQGLYIVNARRSLSVPTCLVLFLVAI